MNKKMHLAGIPAFTAEKKDTRAYGKKEATQHSRKVGVGYQSPLNGPETRTHKMPKLG